MGWLGEAGEKRKGVGMEGVSQLQLQQLIWEKCRCLGISSTSITSRIKVKRVKEWVGWWLGKMVNRRKW